MPSGKTHDRISWFLYFPFAYIIWDLLKDFSILFLFSVSYLFSCFMFSGDLDLVSNQSKRWGVLRWLWIPYRKMMRHRSTFSHGIIIGTAVRILYLTVFGVLFYSIFYFISYKYFPNANASVVKEVKSDLIFIENQPKAYFIAILSGLVMGAAVHTLSDETVSFIKRLSRRKKKKKKR